MWGCLGKSKKRRKAVISIVRSPSPGCRCSCHGQSLQQRKQVISSCDPKQSYELNRSESRELRHSRRSKSPGSRSLERTRSPRSLERQLSFAMDVTYVTEKIIVVTFP
ncbi:hypothetical protein MRX96_036798 [Rhipicephalus microplus]